MADAAFIAKTSGRTVAGQNGKQSFKGSPAVKAGSFRGSAGQQLVPSSSRRGK
jgi:hypothetical protein